MWYFQLYTSELVCFSVVAQTAVILNLSLSSGVSAARLARSISLRFLNLSLLYSAVSAAHRALPLSFLRRRRTTGVRIELQTFESSLTPVDRAVNQALFERALN